MKTIGVRAHLLASVVLGAAAVFVPPAAHAQPPPKGGAAAPKADAKTPRELYKGGETKFKAGDYAGALADFQAVDSIKATPQAAHFIGLCQDKLGHYQEAVAAYERFLADVPAKMAKEGETTKKRVDEIKAMPGKVHVETTPAGALVSIDGKTAQPSPVDVELPAGKHTVHVTADQREPQDRDLDVTFASKTDVNLQLAEKGGAAAAAVLPAADVGAPPPLPPTPPPAAPPPPAEPRSKVPAFVTGGLAVVAAGVGTVFGIMALNDKSNFDNNPTTQTADDGENHALIADMAFGVAVTLGVTSAVLFLTNDEPAPKAASAAPKSIAKNRAESPRKNRPLTITPSPIVTPHGGGAGALIRF